MLPTALMILTAILAVIGGWVIVRVIVGDRAKGRLRCPACWYDMQGSPTLVCPECGHDAVDAKRLTRTRRRYRRVLAGLMLIAVAWYAMEVSYRVKFEHEPISTAAVPTTWYAAVYPALDHPARLLLIERLKRVRGNKTDVWTWQGWLLAKQAARAIEREQTDTTIRGDSFDLLAVVVGRIGCGGGEVLQGLARTDISDGERAMLIGCASTLWDQTRNWDYVDSISKQLSTDFGDPAAALSRVTSDDYMMASDAELQQLFAHALPAQRGFGPSYVYWDRLLIELTRRPQLAEPMFAEALPRTRREFDPPYRSAELLAAYRRVRGEPPPIAIALAPESVTWSDLQRTEVLVTFSSVRTRRDEVFLKTSNLTSGLGYSHYRVVVSREDGRQVQNSGAGSMDIFEPIRFGFLQPNSPVSRTFALSRYTRPPAGKYQLRVQYHDRLQIAAMEDVSGLIIFESEPVELIVE